jgi:succinoglycan biosynthesis transport protein ExoP
MPPAAPPTPAPEPTAPPSGPPAALASNPTVLRLVKSLRRCWLRATVVGVAVAGAAAFVAYSVIPTSTFYVRTLIRVPAGSGGVIFNGPGQPIGDHQRNQVAFVRSRFVLMAALKRPGVGELGVIKKLEKEPVEWLEKELQTDFSVAPEILRIGITGENPNDLKVLIDNIREAYRNEIVDRERKDRSDRLNFLTKKYDEYTQELRTKKAAQIELERQGVSKEAGVRILVNQFARMQLGWYEKELIQTESDLRRQKNDLAALRMAQKNLPTAVIPDAEVQALLAADRTVEGWQTHIDQLRAWIDEARGKAVAGEANASVQTQKKKLAEAEKSLADLKKRLAPEVVERVRNHRVRTTAEAIATLEARISTGAVGEKDLHAEVDRLRQNIQKMADDAAKYDVERENTAQLEKMVDRVGDEAAKLKFEADAPPRSMMTEEAVAQRATDDKRLIMMTTGVFLGTLGLILLGFALHDFRARRIDTVDEVVHGLGMNLIGTIPDSRAALAETDADGETVHNTLGEAVDATRVLLLRAAQVESLRVVMITSAHGGEGKTSLSTHLAASLAQAGLNTLLIDGDLRNPVAHQVFDLDPAPGFCELLREEVTADAVVRPTPVERLSMIPAGRWSSKAGRGLARDGIAGRIIRQFREQYDFVIIDSSPVLPVVDPLLLGQMADGTILSVLRDVSRMPSVYAAHQRLVAGGVRVLGAVVNGVRGEVYGTTYPYRQRVG